MKGMLVGALLVACAVSVSAVEEEEEDVTDMGGRLSWDSHFEEFHKQILADDVVDHSVGRCRLAEDHREADRPDLWGCAGMSKYKCERSSDYCEFVRASEWVDEEDEEAPSLHIPGSEFVDDDLPFEL
eukprot:TRINITY_DN3837_c0_g1_i6.p2 TRINITY_DN3837_c0_g1~~TRINITY_DN3837_c0_g1_i6.p2  ORF type:complete len:128 (-),score=36.21 TRINITY_DN3837_c0_g1_i6:588-971(-)